jgi:methionine synthase / methylenetetrahydrofolate reductase(NADPH)
MGSPRIKQVFDMDSSLMLFEARFLRETSRIHFTGEELKDSPRPFLGAAINPFTTPTNIPIRRLKQKAAAGADFIQTQLIFDIPRFREFMNQFTNEGLDEELFLIAGVPVVISKGALNMLPHVPGVVCSDDINRRLNDAKDIQDEGCVHLMLLGTDYSVLPDIVTT